MARNKACAKFTAVRYPDYAFPSTCMCMCMCCVTTRNNRRFWIRDDILLYGGRLCGSAVCPPSSANSSRLGRENPSSRRNTSGNTRDVPFTFVSVHKSDSQAHAIFFFFFSKYVHTSYTHIILLRANELISILDTSVKSS